MDEGIQDKTDRIIAVAMRNASDSDRLVAFATVYAAAGARDQGYSFNKGEGESAVRSFIKLMVAPEASTSR